MMRERHCAFCRIVDGEGEAMTVFRNDACLAFLDRRPLFRGHCLVVPCDHYETLPDLPAPLIEPLFSATRLLTAAVPVAMEAEGAFVAINNRVSQSVPHLHVHVVPRRPKDGLRGFFWPRTAYGDDRDARSVAEAIRNAIELAKGARND